MKGGCWKLARSSHCFAFHSVTSAAREVEPHFCEGGDGVVVWYRGKDAVRNNWLLDHWIRNGKQLVGAGACFRTGGCGGKVGLRGGGGWVCVFGWGGDYCLRLLIASTLEDRQRSMINILSFGGLSEGCNGFMWTAIVMYQTRRRVYHSVCDILCLCKNILEHRQVNIFWLQLAH